MSMLQQLYEEMARFAAEGELALELQRAKAEYAARTGDMFETDPSFERRIASFLEWYVLDRKVSFRPDYTPAELFIVGSAAATRSEQERAVFMDLTRTRLALFELKKMRGDRLHLYDLLGDEKVQTAFHGTLAALSSGDILEARLMPVAGGLMMSDICYCYPKVARRPIQKLCKRFREQGGGRDERIALVHRAAFFANRCERYKHVNPKQIFAELVATKAAA